MLQVGRFELVEALELLERLEFLGGASSAAERTEHALRVVPVDTGRVPAVSKGRRGREGLRGGGIVGGAGRVMSLENVRFL